MSDRFPSLTRAYVGLGANLGDARATLEAACAELQHLPQTHWVGRSRFYRSAPVDSQGPDYVNAAAAVDTGLTPMALLEALLEIEQRHGRERPYVNAPRTLDLDLLLYGDLQQATGDRLILPHPRGHLRAFVLLPLLELTPEARWPGRGLLADLVRNLPDQELSPLE
jgi:2-amino-4-hydroxy-6-hydroxymethyldihydropteridine diphosphokinase